ncbi:glycosyltransferase [Novosphingobium album (ex Hu et al. 2023)]|uniref:glycosyltransferase n=1 Tax=Novosphingobium album (ex Hu et al. 2023) TaxID=2930093 RepID=UPI001FBB69BE|nr:glycosyltransferase [Novosphingobium album (ex Hu et al. 2023)]
MIEGKVRKIVDGDSAFGERIVHCDLGGGAAIAANRHAQARAVRAIDLHKTSPWMRFLRLCASLLNRLFRLEGEDYIWPIFLSAGSYEPQRGDELHWVLCPEIDLRQPLPSGVSLYVHDEWWSQGWAAYAALSSRFEYAPLFLPGLRHIIRNWLAKHCEKRLRRTAGLATMISPSRYMQQRYQKKGFQNVLYDPSQLRLLTSEVRPELVAPTSAQRTVDVIFYAPSASWYRKGSDLTAALAYHFADREMGEETERRLVLLGGYGADGSKGTSANVEVLGRLSQDALLSKMANAKVVVFLTRNDNLPNVIIEALAKGCLVLTTPFSGGVEASPDRVHLARSADMEALTLQLRKLLDDAQCRSAV